MSRRGPVTEAPAGPRETGIGKKERSGGDTLQVRPRGPSATRACSFQVIHPVRRPVPRVALLEDGVKARLVGWPPLAFPERAAARSPFGHGTERTFGECVLPRVIRMVVRSNPSHSLPTSGVLLAQGAATDVVLTEPRSQRPQGGALGGVDSGGFGSVGFLAFPVCSTKKQTGPEPMEPMGKPAERSGRNWELLPERFRPALRAGRHHDRPTACGQIHVGGMGAFPVGCAGRVSAGAASVLCSQIAQSGFQSFKVPSARIHGFQSFQVLVGKYPALGLSHTFLRGSQIALRVPTLKSAPRCIRSGPSSSCDRGILEARKKRRAVISADLTPRAAHRTPRADLTSRRPAHRAPPGPQGRS